MHSETRTGEKLKMTRTLRPKGLPAVMAGGLQVLSMPGLTGAQGSTKRPRRPCKMLEACITHSGDELGGWCGWPTEGIGEACQLWVVHLGQADAHPPGGARGGLRSQEQLRQDRSGGGARWACGGEGARHTSRSIALCWTFPTMASNETSTLVVLGSCPFIPAHMLLLTTHSSSHHVEPAMCCACGSSCAACHKGAAQLRRDIRQCAPGSISG